MKHLALVVVGGSAGTLSRYGVTQWMGDGRLFPLDTFAVNISGSFLLGALLAVLLARGDNHARDARLLLGTGFLGGYTTYSALAVQTDALLRDDHIRLGLAYAVSTVVAGLVAALIGVAAGRKLAR